VTDKQLARRIRAGRCVGLIRGGLSNRRVGSRALSAGSREVSLRFGRIRGDLTDLPGCRVEQAPVGDSKTEPCFCIPFVNLNRTEVIVVRTPMLPEQHES
jgi:hypothetical protein